MILSNPCALWPSLFQAFSQSQGAAQKTASEKMKKKKKRREEVAALFFSALFSALCRLTEGLEEPRNKENMDTNIIFKPKGSSVYNHSCY